MKVAIGADHRGINLKQAIVTYLIRKGHGVTDFGTHSSISVDYPDIAFDVARAVAARKVRFGILICFTGLGMSMAANKVEGVRAARCMSARDARMARAHNNANVLVLPGYNGNKVTVQRIIRTFFTTPFEGGRHARRVKKIARYEKAAHTKRLK
jgi:ribose 5-phosphate isomerase B